MRLGLSSGGVVVAALPPRGVAAVTFIIATVGPERRVVFMSGADEVFESYLASNGRPSLPPFGG
jgi:hypothetical protein